MRRYYKFLLIIAFFIVCAPYIFVSLFAVTTVKTKNAKSLQQQTPAVLVQVTQVKTANLPKQISALGSLTSTQKVTMSSEVAGRVDKLFFKSGQVVGKGMPIVQLDDSKASADYESAVTALQLSRSNLARVQSLPVGTIAQQDVEKLQATVKSDEANVKSAQATLSQKEITAPFTGVLGSFQVNVGDYVSPGQALVTLVNSDQLQVDYSVSEDNLPELKIGQLVTVTSSAYPNQRFVGTVNFISPTVDKSTRAVAVQAIVPNKKSQLSSGMFVHVEQQIATVQGAMVIPQQAVTADVKGYTVYKIVNNRANLISITIGARFAGQVQVLSGLKVGDTVVIAGQQKLQDGMAVQLMSQYSNGASSATNSSDQSQPTAKTPNTPNTQSSQSSAPTSNNSTHSDGHAQ